MVSQPLRWPSMIPPLVFMPCIVLSHTASRLACGANGIQQKWWHVTSEARLSKTLWWVPHFLSHINCFRTSYLPHNEDIQAASGEAHMTSNRGLLPKARDELRPLALGHVRSHDGSGSSSPSEAFRWLQPQWAPWLQLCKKPWARTTHLSCSHISWPSKTMWDKKCLLL